MRARSGLAVVLWTVAELSVLCLDPASARARTLRALGPTGAPLGHAEVQAYRAPKSRSILETATAPLVAVADEQGSLVLDLAAASSYVLVVDHPQSAPLVVLDEADSLSELRVPPGERLRVEVDTPSGSGAPAGRLCASWSETLSVVGIDHQWERCAAGKAGTVIEIPGLPRRGVELTAEFRGFLAPAQRVDPGQKPVRVRLQRGVLLSGFVKDTRGAPIEAASLEAPVGLHAKSSKDGAFELTVARLPIELHVAAPGYLSSSVPVARGKGSGLDLRLPQAAAILATIVSSRREPLRSVELSVERRDGADWAVDQRATALGSHGELVVPVAVPGEYRLRIRAHGHREWISPHVTVDEGSRADLGLVRLSTGGVLQGIVVGAERSQPLPGVEVSAVARSTALLAAALRGEAIARVVTAADGSFELSGLEIGSYEVRLEHPRRALLTVPAEVTEDGVVDLGMIDLDAGLKLSGKVVDRRDRGLPGTRVEVLASARDAQVPVTTITAGEGGRFRLGPLAPGDYVVRALARRLLVSQEVHLGPDAGEPLLLRSNGVLVKGWVLRHGEPVSGGSVVLRSALDPTSHRGIVIVNTGGGLPARRELLGEPSSEVSAVVGADGSFEVSEVSPGPVQLSFVGPGGEATDRRITVPDAAESAIEVEVGGLPLVGSALDKETKRGLAALITATQIGGGRLPTVQAGSDGSFTIPDLEAGTYRVAAEVDGYRPTAVVARVEEGMAPLSIPLDRGTTSAFAVRLSRASGPAAFVPVTLLDANGAMTGSLLTDFDGQTHFDDIADGRYAIVWADPLGGVGSSGWLTVSDSARSLEQTLSQGSDVRISCEASTCGGALVSLLQVFDAAGVEIGRYLPGLFGAHFSVEGSLALGRLSPGRYLVVVDVAGRRMQRQLSIEGGETAKELDLGG